MDASKNTEISAPELRQIAEQKAAAHQPGAESFTGEIDAKRLLHELQVHQIELEMQNEELRRTKEVLRTSEEQLRETLEAAESANIKMTRLLKVVAHEFRTPLGLLTFCTDLLNSHWDRLTIEKRTALNEHIQSAAYQLTNLISSVISFNKLGEDYPDRLTQPEDIGEICHTIAAEIETVRGNGQTFLVTIAADCGTAFLDKALFRRILENLLTNAFRFTPSDGTVSLCVRREEKQLCMEIGDTGVGIPEEDHLLIFDAFFRGQNAIGHRGLGLGLSIVQDALSRFGGNITVNSKNGAGTTFRVEIPVGDFGRNKTHNSGERQCTQF